jgi:hypothetical protein
MRLPISIALPALTLTALAWIYFDSAGFPLSGTSLIVVMGISLLLAYGAALSWKRIRTRSGRHVDRPK